MALESSPRPSLKSRIATWMLLFAACLLLGALIAALTLALFGAKQVIEPYILPDAGSTTGL